MNPIIKIVNLFVLIVSTLFYFITITPASSYYSESDLTEYDVSKEENQVLNHVQQTQLQNLFKTRMDNAADLVKDNQTDLAILAYQQIVDDPRCPVEIVDQIVKILQDLL
jgi:hypothetical protein